MRIGDVLRYDRTKSTDSELVDGLPNFWHATRSDGLTRPQLERGISPIARAGERVPAVLISSSPHKAGSLTTPWEDRFEPDRGRVRYYGDSRADLPRSPHTPGNLVLLRTFSQQCSPEFEVRAAAPPLLLFRRRGKGFVEFQGVGVIEELRLVTQVEPKSGTPFTNFVAGIVVLDQSAEGEVLDWDWISARRDPERLDTDCLKLAPESWRTWTRDGASALPRLRRSIARMSIVRKEDQLPPRGSKADKVLLAVMEFYKERKAHFEALAEVIAARVLSGETPGTYRMGWITSRGHDHGTDFVGRIDVGTGFSGTSLVVLGQAKCERAATSGRDIARTVARLQRGWIGCYVTTSYFSPSVQIEIAEDEFPLVLIHGKRVAEEVLGIMMEDGSSSVTDLLEKIDGTYRARISDRRPDEILMDH